MSKNVKAGGAYVELGVRDKLDAGLKAIQGKLNSFARSATTIGATLAASGAAIAGPFVAAGKIFGSTGANLDDIANRTGVAGSKLSEYAYAAEVAGTSIDAVEKGLGKMAKTLYSADEESKNAVESLAALGLNVEQLKGLSPDQQFEAIADAISKIEDPTSRTALAMKVFGGAGMDLIPMLSGGAAGLAEMGAQARKLGVAMTSDGIAKAAALDDSMMFLTTSLKGFALAIGEAVAGPLTWFFTTATGVISTIVEWVKNNQTLVVTVAAIGATLGGLGAALVAGGAAAATMATVLGAAGAAVSAMLSPVGLLAAAIIGIGAAIYTWTDYFDPMIAYIQETFAWVSELVSTTVAGIATAIGNGQITEAAMMAFSSLRIMAGATMDAVTGVFGTSIEEISGFFVELYRQIGIVFAKVREFITWISNGITYVAGAAMGLDTEIERQASADAAAAFTDSFRQIDSRQVGERFGKLFDPELIRQELDSMIANVATESGQQVAEALAAPAGPGGSESPRDSHGRGRSSETNGPSRKIFGRVFRFRAQQADRERLEQEHGRKYQRDIEGDQGAYCPRCQ